MGVVLFDHGLGAVRTSVRSVDGNILFSLCRYLNLSRIGFYSYYNEIMYESRNCRVNLEFFIKDRKACFRACNV